MHTSITNQNPWNSVSGNDVFKNELGCGFLVHDIHYFGFHPFVEIVHLKDDICHTLREPSVDKSYIIYFILFRWKKCWWWDERECHVEVILCIMFTNIASTNMDGNICEHDGSKVPCSKDLLCHEVTRKVTPTSAIVTCYRISRISISFTHMQNSASNPL